MTDLIVSLYRQDFSQKQVADDIKIVRVLTPNSDAVINFVEKHFSKGWASEVKAALYQATTNCFIAVQNNKIVGFSAYDATAKGYLGPIGVDGTLRGKNIGSALMSYTLEAMYHDGYGYAIIGGVNEKVVPFYEKTCGAKIIEIDGNVYDRLLRGVYE